MNRRLVIAVVAIAALSAAAVASAATLAVNSGRLTTFQLPGITGASMTAIAMHDQDTDGFVDQVIVDFDGDVGSTNLSDWAVANVPSGGSLASPPAVVGSQVFLTLNPTTDVPDTAVGTFTVTLNDTTGGLVSFGPTAPADKAGPVPVAVATTNAAGGTAGLMQAGDTLTITFSEALAAATVPASVAVTQLDDPATGADFLNIPGVTSGALDLGSLDYLLARNKQATFASSAAALTSPTALRVTAAGPCSGDCMQLRAGQGVFVFAPAATITDLAANAAAGTFPTAATFRLF